jgi:hypothetical protein
MKAIDANILSLLIYPSKYQLVDFRTKLPIDRAVDRAWQIVEQADADSEPILVATPALAEALAGGTHNIQAYLDEISKIERLKIFPFGIKASVELAIRTRKALDSGNKRDGVEASWAKVKYDRQIVSIAKVEGASVIYSTDEDVHKHGLVWGIETWHLADVKLPIKQGKLLDMERANETV